MKLSRRDFIQAGCVAGAIALAPHCTKAGINNPGIGSSGGGSLAPTSRMQINLYTPTETLDYPFLDFVKCSASTFVTNALGFATDQWGLLNADGYPQSGSGWGMSANFYFVSGQPIVLDWTGTGITFTLGNAPAGYTFTENVGNRTNNSREYNVTNGSASFGDSVSCSISISGSANNTLTSIRLYYKQYQATLNSGKRFDPNFINRYKGFGRIRFMDWMSTNGSQIAQWSNRVSDTNISAFGMNITSKNYCSFFTKQAENDWSSATAPTGWVDNTGTPIVNPSSWADGQMIQGCAQALTPTACTAANPAQLTVTAHGLSTGDVVFGVNMQGAYSILNTQMQITVVDANNFTVVKVSDGTNLDTTGFAAFTTFFTCVINIPRTLTVTGFSNHATAPVVTTAIAHNYSVNDIICFAVNSLHGGTFNGHTDYNYYTVASTPTSTTFTISLNSSTVDSTGWGTFTNDGSGKVSKQIRYKAGALPYKRLILNSLDPIGAGSFTGDPMARFDNNHFVAFQLTYNAAADGLMISQVGPFSRWGCSYEMIIAAANELNTNPWFCIPFFATDDFVTRFATLVKAGLNPWLTPCFEFTNELWNTGLGFSQTFAAQRLSYITWPTQTIGSNGQAIGDLDNYYSMRFYQIMTLIDAVYSGSGLPYKRIMGVFTAFYGVGQQTNRYKAPLATAGGQIPTFPITKADSICIAPYIQGSTSSTGGLTGEGQAPSRIIWENAFGTPATAIQYLLDYSTNDGASNSFTFNNLTSTIYPGWKAQAVAASGFAGHTVTLTQYEGGFNYNVNENAISPNPYTPPSTGTPVTLTLTQRAQYYRDVYSSAGWAALYQQHYLNDFVDPAIGNGEYPSQYVSVQNWGSLTNGSSPTNYWGTYSPNGFATPVAAWANMRAF